MDCLHNVADQFWDQLRNGLTLGSIYAMIALGYTMVYGVLQLINFAHSEVFMVSTFTTLYAVRDWFNVTAPITGGKLLMVMVGALIPAMIISGVLAVLLERLAYRPLRRRGAPRLSFLISAIGASLFIQYLFVLMDGLHYIGPIKLPAIAGPNPQAVPELFKTSTVFHLFGTDITNKRIMIVVAAGVMLFILDRFVRLTRLGRGIRAVAQDPEAASMMGVNIDKVIVTTFFVGGIMAGAAGFFYTIVPGAPAFWFVGFLPGIKAFAAAVLGGIGNIRGAMLGGLLLGVVETQSSACFGTQWVNVTAFVVLVLVLLFKPTGILGEQVAS
ncbi:MAG: branched-chain amino acid transport system permease protein [Actinomycetota bacterium]|nr:branched-chain amino acid transport system permease protein [Actinomycetota bacterium]